MTELPHLLKNLVRFKGEHFVFISFTDYILTELFIKYKRAHNPQFGFIFLNSIAHLQHHHWHGHNYKENERLVFGLNYVDRILESLLKEVGEDDTFICLNALSQKNTNREKPWILYRQKDQRNFLTKIGLNPLKIEPHMTHDAHLFFEDEQSRKNAQKILEEAVVNDSKLFLVEDYPAEPRKLFYRICFTDEISPASLLKINGQTFNFFDLFEPIVTRTGKHIQAANIFSNAPNLPGQLYNHELFSHLLRMFPDEDTIS